MDELRKPKPGAKIDLAGFCYELSPTKVFVEENSKFDGTFAAHLSFLSYSELKTRGANCITQPVSLAVADSDIYYNSDRARDTEAHLRQKGFTDVEVSIYKSFHNGWTTRGNLADPVKKNAKDRADTQAMDWFESRQISQVVS
ncbi:hypothetical protein FISHEDRAFT_58556 [Fistulina hepatica ATCC 64428]|uniref:Dienelactone hydrolase domain-containing protein n=1 Tax=Fistulina hepatica ATCC 64428 TaxID=1128425 RepID=A0A0D7ADH1_9AGAR|nr:hypothetical protein FISHEDRAFT_58556 [Fistulina hepatica ATCC 64428]